MHVSSIMEPSASDHKKSSIGGGGGFDLNFYNQDFKKTYNNFLNNGGGNSIYEQQLGINRAKRDFSKLFSQNHNSSSKKLQTK